MSGINFNITDRKASREFVPAIEIFDMSDFPAPSLGVISLPSGTYIIKNDLVTGDVFVAQPGAAIIFTYCYRLAYFSHLVVDLFKVFY